MKRLAALVLVLVVLGTGLGLAVGRLLTLDDDADPSGEPGPPPPSESGADRAPEVSLDRFYDQELDWRPCGEHECARLVVPLDYDRPQGRTIRLAVLRVPALGERRAPLVVNPGGPGAPGTAYAAAADQIVGPAIREEFDIVGFDPRGTGSSAPVDCLTDEELDRYVSVDPVPDDAAEQRALLDTIRDRGRGCVADDAALAAHITTIEAARDMDVLRSALGRRTLDYLGKSYGTELGATYAELFPRRVGAMVLDGAVDVSLSSRRLSLEQARGFETALRAYVANCVETVDSCFLGDSVEEGLSRITAFLADVDANPLPTTSGRELTVGNAFYGIVAPLYVRDYWFALSAGLQDGFDGDGSALLGLSDVYSSRGPDGYTDNSTEAFPAISCLDDPWSVPPARVPAQVPAFQRASPTFGDVFAWGLMTCHGIQTTASEPAPEIDAAGAAPILVVGTTRDPATPYQWAVHLADQLESGVLLSRDGDGHTGYNAGNDCVNEAVEDYLVDGTVPEDGLQC